MGKIEKHEGFYRVKIGGKDEFDISHLLTPEENAQREAWLNRNKSKPTESEEEKAEAEATDESQAL